MSKHTGINLHSEKHMLGMSRTLTNQYYSERGIAKKETLSVADRRKASARRYDEIADCIRAKGESAAALDLKASRSLIDKVKGEMLLGRYGGL